MTTTPPITSGGSPEDNLEKMIRLARQAPLARRVRAPTDAARARTAFRRVVLPKPAAPRISPTRATPAAVARS